MRLASDMTKLAPLLLVLLPFSLCAQLDLLTLREAYSIAARIPAIVEATKNGWCPRFSATYASPDEIWIQARCSCSPKGGMLVNNYSVNRRTGIATTWSDDGEPVLDAGGQAFAERLGELARNRRLNSNEARCLALEAAKGLSGWSRNDAVVTVTPFPTSSVPGPEPEKASFTALNHLSSEPLEIDGFLTVDLSTAEVRDNQTGMNVSSAGLGALRAKVIALREPVILTDEEAMSIALSTPSVAVRIPKGCVLSGGGAYYPDQVVAGVACKDGSNHWAIEINLKTGEIVDAETRKTVDPTGATLSAREFLDKRKRELVQVHNELDALCGPR